MKITFADNSVGHFKLWHEYGSDDRYYLKRLTEAGKIYTDTIKMFNLLNDEYNTKPLYGVDKKGV